VGVQRDGGMKRDYWGAFQFPYCAWEFNHGRLSQDALLYQFQFPYCAWEFNVPVSEHLLKHPEVSIPILRVGVQQLNGKHHRLCLMFQFPYCAWEFNSCRTGIRPRSRRFQFPYCAWEFNRTCRTEQCKLERFNSHTARGSSTLKDQYLK